MMQRKNTFRHWAALSVARYYDKYEQACRARDLYPHVQIIFGNPDRLVGTLSKINEIFGIKVTASPNSDGGRTRAYAYYPTQETIEALEEVGEPTKLPDGSDIPDGTITTIPEKSAGEDEDIEVTETSQTGMSYVWMGHSEGDGDGKPRDTPLLQGEPDTTIGPVEEPEIAPADEPDEDDPDTTEDVETLRDETEASESKHKPHVPKTDTERDMFSVIDTPTAGGHAGDTDWNKLASRLERKAADASDNGLTEVASAYSQFATMAVEGTLDKRTAYILLGTPVLEFEAEAQFDIHETI